MSVLSVFSGDSKFFFLSNAERNLRFTSLFNSSDTSILSINLIVIASLLRIRDNDDGHLKYGSELTSRLEPIELRS